MAELVESEGKGKGGSPKPTKRSTKVDMTAMVDVAFLLLTFFVLTTTLSDQRVTKFTNPPKNDNTEINKPPPVAQSKILNMILIEDNKVLTYYQTDEMVDPDVKIVNFSEGGVRKAIEKHINRRPDRCPPGADGAKIKQLGCWDPIILIKANVTSQWIDLVNITDELRITNAPKFTVGEINSKDSTVLANNNIPMELPR